MYLYVLVAESTYPDLDKLAPLILSPRFGSDGEATVLINDKSLVFQSSNWDMALQT